MADLEVIRFRCSKELKDKVTKAANKEHRTVSNYLKTIITKELDKTDKLKE